MANLRSVLDALEACRKQGNDAYARGKFGAAAAAYTDGIILRPSTSGGGGLPRELASPLSVLHSNRGQCHRARGAWAEAESDAREAAELDRANDKALLLLGLAAARRGSPSEALRALEAGAAQARRRRRAPALLREFAVAAASARLSVVARAADEAREADALLESALTAAVKSYASTPATASLVSMDLDAACTPAVLVPATLDGAATVEISVQSLLPQLGDCPVDARWQITRMSGIFAERERARSDRTVPDHFQCPITCDVMLDPVVGPSGTSFEREALLRALKSKLEDPISRAPMRPDQLIPNLALKAVIEGWLAINPWASPLLPDSERI